MDPKAHGRFDEQSTVRGTRDFYGLEIRLPSDPCLRNLDPLPYDQDPMTYILNALGPKERTRGSGEKVMPVLRL